MCKTHLDIPRLNFPLQLVQPALLLPLLPRRPPRVEHLVHLLERVPLGLGREQRHMDESSRVESAKDVVHLVGNVPQQRRHAKGEHHVPEPVGGGRERDSLGADLAREDLGWVSPRDGTPCRGESGDEEVGARYNGGGDGAVVVDDPGDVAVLGGAGLGGVGLAVVLLEGTWGCVRKMSRMDGRTYGGVG